MKRFVFLVALVLAFNAVTPVFAADSTTAAQVKFNTYAQEIFRLVNKARVQNGVPPLAHWARLKGVAMLRAKELERRYSHDWPNGQSFSSAYGEYQIFPQASSWGSGENIAMGQRSPEDVMRSWMNSEGHRANILEIQYTDIGLGVYQDSNDEFYWVQNFSFGYGSR